MSRIPQRSLRYEYDLFVEEEIENYKDSISRSSLLKIGDEAVAALGAQAQFALTEMIVWEEVDKIIRKRLRIPTYATWRKRILKQLEELRRPERWGLRPDEVLVREVRPSPESCVLVASSHTENTALYFAAHGCEVTAVDPNEGVVDRVMAAAEAAGLTARVHPFTATLGEWAPESEMSAVIYTAEAFNGLTGTQRAEVIAALQTATRDGGIHLVRTIAAGSVALSLEELRATYDGWSISVEKERDKSTSFLARKQVA
jgi:hypothetical protein